MELLFLIALTKIFIFGVIISTFLFRQGKQLNCGLFGGSFNQPIDALMMEKLKTLGLFNMSRGKDSCGYYNGSDLVKGVDKDKEFFDFVVNQGINYNDNGNNVFIGHTRQATWGLHTEENAHPFNVGNKIILAHNGTLKNIWELCRKNDIPTVDIKVDSLALGYLLLKKNYYALSEYEGAAALLLHRLKEPNSLYVYHGFSKESQYMEPKEERPLFWMEAAVGVYVSSMKGALEFIKSEGDKDPEEIPHNSIFKIRNGVIIKKPVAVVDRSEIFKSTYQPPVVTTQFPGTSNVFRNAPKTSNTHSHIGRQLTIEKDEDTGLDILKETVPSTKRTDINKLYPHKGRYWESLTNKLAQGIYNLNRKTGEILTDSTTCQKMTQLYFWKGVFIDGKKNYEYINNSFDLKTTVYYHLTDPVYNFAKRISEFAKYPVANMSDESISCKSERNKWFKGGKIIVSESQTFLFGLRDFHFRDGKLVKVIGTKGERIFVDEPLSDEKKKLVDKLIGSALNDVKIPKEVEEAAKRFDVVYPVTYDVKSVKAELGGYCNDALDFYMEDIINEVLDMVYDSNLSNRLVYELIESAIEMRKPIRELLDTQIQSIEFYLIDAMGEKDEEGVQDAIIIEEEVEEDEREDKRTEMQKRLDGIHKMNAVGLSLEQKYEIAMRYKDDETGFNKPLSNEVKEIINAETNFHKPGSGEEEYSVGDYGDAWAITDKSFPPDEAIEDEECREKLPELLKTLDRLKEMSEEFKGLKSSSLAKNVSLDILNATDNLIKGLKDEFASSGDTEGLSIIKSTFNDSAY